MGYEQNREGEFPSENNENTEFTETIDYVDKKGMHHQFKSTADLSQFREEENENGD